MEAMDAEAFLEGARAVTKRFDNTERNFAAPFSSLVRREQLPAAADEAEVRAYVL